MPKRKLSSRELPPISAGSGNLGECEDVAIGVWSRLRNMLCTRALPSLCVRVIKLSIRHRVNDIIRSQARGLQKSLMQPTEACLLLFIMASECGGDLDRPADRIDTSLLGEILTTLPHSVHQETNISGNVVRCLYYTCDVRHVKCVSSV